MEQQPLSRFFGKTSSGDSVMCIALKYGDMTCEILTYGGIVHRLIVPDRLGNATDVVLGFDTLQEYEQQDYYIGALVGRCANRIADGRFLLDNVTYTVAVNSGPNHLHGGNIGFNRKIWTIDSISSSHVTLSLDSSDGDEGYPGHMKVQVTYRLEGKALTISYHATTDKTTICNLTNHSYFNLSGHGSGSILNQELQLFASHYTPTNQYSIPTGEIATISSTPMDFTQKMPIGQRIDSSFQALVYGNGYDHNWCIDGQIGVLRPAAWAYSRETGIGVQVNTTLPGVQLYTANYLPENMQGKHGAVYGPRCAFCLETQHYPDAIHHPNFPSPILLPDSPYYHQTQFTFFTE